MTKTEAHGRILFLFGRPLSDITLIEVEERAFGVRFPDAYKRIVQGNDGAIIDPSAVRFINPGTGIEEVIECNQLIPFQESESDCMTMAEANREIIPFLPLGVIVFGIEAGGYLFGFDYRGLVTGSTDVPIVLLHYDNAPEHHIIKVAESFDHLLDKFESQGSDSDQ